MEKLNAIKEKIYAACFEKDFATWKHGKPAEVYPELADVLRAIHLVCPRKQSWYVRYDGQFLEMNAPTHGPKWNLALNLDENIKENPELGEFLLKILDA